MTTLTDPKVIQYNRLDRDYSAWYDGEFIGAYPNYHAAELALDDHALYLLEQGLVDTVPASVYADDSQPGGSGGGDGDTTTYAPIGDCALCHNPAWHLDESCTGLLCPDHRAQETEWIANRYVAIVHDLAPTAGRELAFCSICNRPFTTTNHDEDYICPDCLASTASTGAPETATAALTAAP